MEEFAQTEIKEAPFSVKWEELMGWFLVPKLGEELSWGMYDIPSRKCSHIYDMKVTGKAKVHGIEGVELTDTHCRYLATMRNDGDVRNYITFLEGDEFLLDIVGRCMYSGMIALRIIFCSDNMLYII